MGRGDSQEQPTPVTPQPKDRFIAVYRLRDEDKQQLLRWVESQSWPQGTELKSPDKYHITTFYSRNGYNNEYNHAWLKDVKAPSKPLRVKSIQAFDTPDGKSKVPIVIEWDADQLIGHALDVAARAKARGMKPLLHSSGYSPHTTIALVEADQAEQLIQQLETPDWQFATKEGLYEHNQSE